MAKDSRARMVRSAAGLISAHGVNATSFADVLAASGAPRGSIYHHFPEGKRQLTDAALRWTAERVRAHLEGAPTTSPAEVLGYFTGMWRRVVITSQAAAGCAVAGVAVDSDATGVDAEATSALPTVRAIFDSWTTLLAAKLGEAGVAAQRAGPIAVTALAAMEGALILCRAAGDVDPLDRVAAELHHLLP